MAHVIVWEVNVANVEVAYPFSINVPGRNNSYPAQYTLDRMFNR